MTKPIVTKEEKEYNATRWSPRPQREAKTKAIAKKTSTKVLQKAPKKPVVMEARVEVEEYVPSDPSYCPTSPIYRPISPRPPYYY